MVDGGVESGFALFVHRGVILGLFVVFRVWWLEAIRKVDFLNRALKKGV